MNYQGVAVLSANYHYLYRHGTEPGKQYLYRVFAGNAAGNSPRSNLATAATYPTPSSLQSFQGQDIGAVAARGSFTESADYFSVWARAQDIYGTSDEFFFVYTQMTGDFSAIVSADHLDDTNPWAKAGLMARASLNANSQYSMVFRNPAGDAGMSAFRQRWEIPPMCPVVPPNLESG